MHNLRKKTVTQRRKRKSRKNKKSGWRIVINIKEEALLEITIRSRKGKKIGRIFLGSEEVFRVIGPTKKHVSRKIRGEGRVHPSVVIKKKGATKYTPY